MNTGVGSLSLLQGIFLTQESNWALLHGRWILYQLSYQGSVSNSLLIFLPVPLDCELLEVRDCALKIVMANVQCVLLWTRLSAE